MMQKILTSLSLSILLISACSEPKQPETPVSTEPVFQNEGHEWVYRMTQKTGTYADLLKLLDVAYTHTYQTPDGKKDVSTEKYLFKGELSLGIYEQHERTLSQITDTLIQGYDGEEFWVQNKGEYLQEEKVLARARFNRKTNFYWFAMFQKMLDPGLKYEYLGEKEVDSITYKVVNVSFSSPDSTPTDIYQLFINPQTLLVDQFLFTVADFGMMETPLLMQVEYEEVDGMLIPSKRKYKKSSWEAEISDGPWIEVNWTDIRFNNGLTPSDFTGKD